MGHRQPDRVPRRPARGHGTGPRRPYCRRRALPRRAGRLARRDPLPYGAKVHAPGRSSWAPGCATATAWTPPRCTRTTGSCSACRTWATAAGRTTRRRGSAGSPVVTAEDLLLAPEEVLDEVRAELGGSIMFAARFREAAARRCCCPAAPGQAAALWQQRQRSAQLLSVASEYPEFPIVLEAARECLQDDFDVAALTDLMRDLAAGRVRLVDVTTPTPSPSPSRSCSGTRPSSCTTATLLAERRAAALSLDPTLLAELLGTEGGASQLADLLDPESVERTEAELGALARPDRPATRRTCGTCCAARPAPGRGGRPAHARGGPRRGADVAREAGGARRVIQVRLAGVPGADAQQWAVVEDAGRLRDALGSPCRPASRRSSPSPFPTRWATSCGATPAPTDRSARTRWRRGSGSASPWPPGAAQARGVAGPGLRAPATRVPRWDGRGVVRRRGAADPAPTVAGRAARRGGAGRPEALGVFLPRWHGIGTLRGTDGLLRVIEQLSGAAVPASALETLVLPSRVTDYSPGLLDELTTTGEVLWSGHSSLPGARTGS
ncbi:hypothetical protein NKG05_00675 [Oerskovia sp. M15]